MLRPGSRTMARPESRTTGRTPRRSRSAVGAARAVVGDAEAAAEIEMLDAMPVAAQLARERDERRRPRAQRLEVRDLRADVRVQADDLEAGAVAACAGRGRARRRSTTPNLLVLRPVEMCGWLRASMSGLTRIATRARVCRVARDGVDALELARRLGVDGLDAEVDRLRQLGVRLADAGEDDLRRDEAGAQRDVDLAAGVGVGAAAEAAQQARDRQRRVGLERVVQRVRVRRERLVDGAVARGDGRGAVDVERRAVGGGERRRAARRRRRGILAGERNPVTRCSELPVQRRPAVAATRALALAP